MKNIGRGETINPEKGNEFKVKKVLKDENAPHNR